MSTCNYFKNWAFYLKPHERLGLSPRSHWESLECPQVPPLVWEGTLLPHPSPRFS